MHPWPPTILSVIGVSLLGLLGAAVGAQRLKSHGLILGLVALAAGALMGDAVLHLLPESVGLWSGFPWQLSALVLGGFGLFFLLEVFLRLEHAHGEAMEPSHGHPDDGHAHARPIAPFGWINLVGDVAHNFLDGAIIAASYSLDAAVGVATTVAVVLHEIPHELGNFAVLLRAGMTRRQALTMNFLTACVAIVGAVVFLLLPFPLPTVQRIALPLTAGGFVYVAAADLVPELHHHAGDRHARSILLAVAAGVAAMALLRLLD